MKIERYDIIVLYGPTRGTEKHTSFQKKWINCPYEYKNQRFELYCRPFALLKPIDTNESLTHTSVQDLKTFHISLYMIERVKRWKPNV